MTDKREKVRSKVLLISSSIILFHHSNGKLYKSSDLLDGLFYVEVTDILIYGLLSIYLYFVVRYFVLRDEGEIKTIFFKIFEYKMANKLYLWILKRKVKNKITSLIPIRNNIIKSGVFIGTKVSIEKIDDIIIKDSFKESSANKFKYLSTFENIKFNIDKEGTCYIEISKFWYYLFIPLSIPMYLSDDYFWETILPYITIIYSYGIILSYAAGINYLIIMNP